MEGVDTFDIDLEQKKVTVKGNVEPDVVFQTVSKTGKKTEFWPTEASSCCGAKKTEEPVAAPPTEAVEVAEPVAAPSCAAVKPVEPVAAPSSEAAKPVEPVTAPSSKVEKPVEPVATPSCEAEKPAEPVVA